MATTPAKIETVDQYIESLPPRAQPVVRELRALIGVAVPGIEEGISYQMPVFRLDGRYLVYVGAWKHHIGLYPIPPLDETLEREIASYRSGQDTVQLPLDKPIPAALVARVLASLVASRGS